MLFNSLAFFLFFPLVTILYFLIPHPWRWALLLAASCVFYMFFVPLYILILFATIVIDYFAGLLLEKLESPAVRKACLCLSLVANIGILCFFKYANFFGENLNAIAHLINWNYSLPALNIVLPIGLSFHTFQAMSYTIEVYRGNQKAERHFGIYALYVMFYPQLVAGPIERPQNMLHQFHEVHRFDYDDATSGLKLMAWGLFKKVVVADRLAAVVNQVYATPDTYSGPALTVATVMFAFQIYCDFSGYSDIAIGSAQVMGFRLMTNFDRPYHARSISEFWRRWHISLSTWFKDYVYVPLGGNKVSALRNSLNLFFVFLISGLWHGANWTFVVWGALHGIYLVVSKLWSGLLAALKVEINREAFVIKSLSLLLTFLAVCYAWIFFRADTTAHAFTIASKVFQGWETIFAGGDLLTRLGLDKVNFPREEWLVLIVSMIVLESVHLAQTRGSVRAQLASWPTPVRWSAYYALGIGTLLLFYADSQQFIYFQF